MVATSVSIHTGSPCCLLALREALQDQQVGLTQAPFKLLPLRGDLEHVRFCVRPLRAESVYLAIRFS